MNKYPNGWLPFSPDVGAAEGRFLRVAAAVARDANPLSCLDEQIQRLSQDRPSRTAARLRFAFSVLADVVAAGGTMILRDSRLYIRWPEWTDPNSQQNLREALVRLRDETLCRRPPPRALCALPPALPAKAISSIASSGAFELRRYTDRSAHGMTYQDIFQAAVTSWSMPYRDREGRCERYVLEVSHPLIGHSMPVGILEIGDGAPFAKLRDKELGFSQETILELLAPREERQRRLATLDQRLSDITNALLPIPEVAQVPPERIYGLARELEDRLATRRRSKMGSSATDEDKRYIYFVRLTRARAAIAELKSNFSPNNKDLYTLVRVMRDLFLTRTHLEITVCGALPPFSEALFGKLVCSYAADPRIRDICRRPIGSILSKAFNRDKLQPLLPNLGCLLVTTSGLYPGHSAQYNRAEIPGSTWGSGQAFKKLGETLGVTASLMSSQTYQAAAAMLAEEQSVRDVSLEYGSGGNKRQRRIEAAANHIGLAEKIIHPNVRRPVYAAKLVNNLPEVVIFSEPPETAALMTDSPEAFSEAAVARWRSRWMEAGSRRIARYGSRLLQGLRDCSYDGSEIANG